MTKNLILFIAILPLMAISCEKDKTDTLDITEHKWELKSVTIGSETFQPKENKSRYVLEFVNDSAYTFNLSVNDGGGIYKIPSKGEITIKSVFFTEKCCENDFDERLLEIFPKNINYTYKVEGSTLTIKNTNNGKSVITKKIIIH
jgi:heat shock protein HslJ